MTNFCFFFRQISGFVVRTELCSPLVTAYSIDMFCHLPFFMIFIGDYHVCWNIQICNCTSPCIRNDR